MKPKKKKDREYMPILDQSIEELKKPIGQPVDFDKIITQLLNINSNKVNNSKSEGQQPLEPH